jgi:response regulator RpfG family c-di-GMP phosphodiesterase
MIESAGRARLLCVDDEPHVLDGLQRSLRGRYDVTTVVGGRAAIERLQSESFGVVMTDMRMPEVDGVDVLKAARDRCPDTTRVLLTGQADLTSAVAAVNDGHVFRFLIKPCPPEQLRSALDDAFAQHRLLTVEHDLLEGTLKGALKVCIDVLGLVHPQALSRGARVRRLASQIAERVGGVELWAIEVAALLADFGAITLPAETLEKLHNGSTLSVGETKQVDRLPALAAQLVGAIPRLEHVRDMLLHQRTQFDGLHSPVRGVAGSAIPLGARILLLADEYDVLETRELSVSARLRTLEARTGRYDPQLLTVLRDIVTERPAVTDDLAGPVSFTTLEHAPIGMVFAEDVMGRNGLVLIGRGQEVSPVLHERIRLLDPATRQQTVRLVKA